MSEFAGWRGQLQSYCPQLEDISGKKTAVITSLGMVTPLGNNVQANRLGLEAGKSRFSTIDDPEVLVKIDPEGKYPDFKGLFSTRVVGMVKDYDLRTAFDGTSAYSERRRFGPDTQFGFGALNEAFHNAGFALERGDKGEIKGLIDARTGDTIDSRLFGTRIGTGLGGALRVLLTDKKLLKALNEKRISRDMVFDMLGIIPDRNSSVSRYLGLKGPIYTVNAACATGIMAMISAIQEIELGRAKIMATGAAEGSSHLLPIALFEIMGALTKETDPDKASCPFDERSDGFTYAGEGAVVFILEEKEHAIRRGAPILAEIKGYGNTADAYSDTDPHPKGEGVRRAMAQALLGLTTMPNGLIVFPHGTSTVPNDSTEAEVINEIDPKGIAMYVSAVKGIFGHMLGVAGPVSVASAVLSLNGGVIYPTIHHVNPREEAKGLNLVPNNAIYDSNADVALISAAAFGGQNGAIVIEKPF